jgi:hypothetical protein
MWWGYFAIVSGIKIANKGRVIHIHNPAQTKPMSGFGA